MKTQNLLLFIALLFCGKAAYAQGITYEKGFNTSVDEYQNDIKEMKSNGYLVTGSAFNSAANRWEAYCIRLNKEGQMLWSKTFGNTFSNVATKCWGTSDGGFVLAFSSQNSEYQYGDTISGIFVVKCNKDGNVKWSKCIKNSKKLNHALYITPGYIYESKNGDIYLLGDCFSFNLVPQFALIKLDATGNLIWEKSITADRSYSYNAVQLAESSNGDIIVAENAYGDGYYTFGSYIHLFSFSQATGTVKLSKSIYQYYNGGYSAFVNVYSVIAEGNKIKITGRYTKDGFYDKTCWFSLKPGDVKVKANYITFNDYHTYQYLINKKLIKQPEGGFNSNSIFTRDGGYLYANRHVDKSTYDVDITVSKYDSLGRICPTYVIPVIDTAIQKTTLTISNLQYSVINNAIAIIVVDTSLTVTDVTAQQTFCEGTAPVITNKFENTSSVIADKISEVKLQLYPNPAADFVNINFEVNKPATIQFNIINTEGKTVLTKQLFASIGKQQTSINIQSLPPGAYYIKITGLTKPAAIQFLKIK